MRIYLLILFYTGGRVYSVNKKRKVVMKNLKDYFLEKTGGKRIMIWGLAFVVFNSLVFPVMGSRVDPSGVYKVFDLFFGYSMPEAVSLLQGIGEKGRTAHFFTTAVADIIYPVIYTFLLSMLIALLIKKLLLSESIYSYFILSPFCVMAFDYLENLSIIIMLASFPDISESMVKTGSFAGIAKWCCTGFVITGIIFLAALLLLRKFLRNKDASSGKTQSEA